MDEKQTLSVKLSESSYILRCRVRGENELRQMLDNDGECFLAHAQTETKLSSNMKHVNNLSCLPSGLQDFDY